MPPISLDERRRKLLQNERETVEARVADLRRQSLALHGLTEAVDSDLAASERLLRQLEEVLGSAPQLPLEWLHEELRGERLREVAVEVLRQRRGFGAVVHYREWM